MSVINSSHPSHLVTGCGKEKKILFSENNNNNTLVQPQENQSTYEITKHPVIWRAHIIAHLLWPNGVQLHDYFLYLDVADGHVGCLYFFSYCK